MIVDWPEDPDELKAVQDYMLDVLSCIENEDLKQQFASDFMAVASEYFELDHFTITV